ncbi:MAG: hypothetical protein DHS20C16_07730 [Phycisphaerae bacterium]|nr:MAG: hypothetical protein DHS20C16_07730 [Phycisphaerae bacterium]
MKQDLNHLSPNEILGLVDSLPAAIWQMDPATCEFKFVSKGAKDLLGYPVEDWLSDPKFWITHLHPEDRRWAVSYCQSAVEAGQSHEFEYRMIASDGRIVWIRDLVKVISRDDEHPVVVGILIDVTRRHKSEQERIDAEEQIRNDCAAEALSELTASVAHDFNNTLTVISMHADILRRSVPAGSELAESIEAVGQALGQAAGLTKSLMAISGDLPSEKKQIDMRTAVSGAQRMARRVLPSEIKLHIENDCAFPLQICADALRIQQLILSLILDARSCMDGGGELTISLISQSDPVEFQKPNSNLSFDFEAGICGFAQLSFTHKKKPDAHESESGKSDSGSNDRFSGADGTISSSVEHYSTVMEIVEDHGAVFGYESAQRGATINVSFPCVPHADAALETNPTSAVEGTKEVLIAENDQQVRDIVAASMKDSGYRVVPLPNRAALEKRFFESCDTVDLIVLDANLPDGGAVEFLHRIRKEGHQTAAIVLAESECVGRFDTLLREATDGNTTLLCKPFSTNSLIGLAERVLSCGGIDS